MKKIFLILLLFFVALVLLQAELPQKITLLQMSNKTTPFGGNGYPINTRVELLDSTLSWRLTHAVTSSQTMATVFANHWYVLMGGSGSGSTVRGDSLQYAVNDTNARNALTHKKVGMVVYVRRDSSLYKLIATAGYLGTTNVRRRIRWGGGAIYYDTLHFTNCNCQQYIFSVLYYPTYQPPGDTTYYHYWNSSNFKGWYQCWMNSDTAWVTTSTKWLQIATSDSVPFRIKNGKIIEKDITKLVGVGISNPLYFLHIKDDLAIQGSSPMIRYFNSTGSDVGTIKLDTTKTSLGYKAHFGNDDYGTYVGASAGKLLINGVGNDISGYDAFWNCTNGAYNSMHGYLAGIYEPAGTISGVNYNTAVGSMAMYNTASGAIYNTVMGYRAGLDMSSATYCTLIGSWAGSSNHDYGVSRHHVIAIGYEAAKHTNEDSLIMIGDYGDTTEAPIVIHHTPYSGIGAFRSFCRINAYLAIRYSPILGTTPTYAYVEGTNGLVSRYPWAVFSVNDSLKKAVDSLIVLNNRLKKLERDSVNWNISFGWGNHAGHYWLFSDTSAYGKLMAYYTAMNLLGLKTNISDTGSLLLSRIRASHDYEPKLPTSTDSTKFLWYNKTFHSIYYSNIKGAPWKIVDGNQITPQTGYYLGQYNITALPDSLLNKYTKAQADAKFPLKGQTFYLGSTLIAINRTTGSLALTGITSIDGSAVNCTNATNIGINQTTTNATYYPVFVPTSSGNNGAVVNSGGLTYNPSTNTLSVANVTGNTSTVTNGRYKTDIISLMLIQADTSMFSDSTFGRVYSDGFIIDSLIITAHSVGTLNVKLAIYYGINWVTEASAVSVVTAFNTITADGVKTATGTINNATVAKGNYVWAKIKGTGFKCKFFSVQIKGHYI